MHFNINLTSLAIILWSGMLIISGSVWVLCSQVRKVADILEEHARHASATSARSERRAAPAARIARASVRRTTAAVATRRVLRSPSDGARNGVA